MREITAAAITKAVKELCVEANYVLPPDIVAAFERGKAAETSPLGRDIFDKMLENAKIARENRMPICQDTGMAMVFIELGQSVCITGDLLENAINQGVREGYAEGYLRCSVLSDPLERKNTDDNTPAVIYTDIVEGDQIKITLAPKGFGSENMTALKMFTPAATAEDIVNFVVETCEKAGSNPCPPIIVGIGLGGTADKALVLAKKALLRPLDVPNPNPFYRALENNMLDKINGLNIGPQGLGGSQTALSVAIAPYATHIAGLPCGVCIGCHVTRHKEAVL